MAGPKEVKTKRLFSKKLSNSRKSPPSNSNSASVELANEAKADPRAARTKPKISATPSRYKSAHSPSPSGNEEKGAPKEARTRSNWPATCSWGRR